MRESRGHACDHSARGSEKKGRQCAGEGEKTFARRGGQADKDTVGGYEKLTSAALWIHFVEILERV